MTNTYTHIIEDTANCFWAVREPSDVALSHCYVGIQVKKTKAGFVPKAKARVCLVRRECAKIIANLH